MSKVEDISDTEFNDLLEEVQLSEHDIVNLSILHASRLSPVVHLFYSSTTGHVGKAVGHRLGSSGRYIKYIEDGTP